MDDEGYQFTMVHYLIRFVKTVIAIGVTQNALRHLDLAIPIHICWALSTNFNY